MINKMTLSIIPTNCQYCSSGQIRRSVHQNLIDRYYDKFNFYFAKPINEILARCQIPHVIHFQDYEYLDSSLEYLKEYYGKPNVKERVQLLEDFIQESGRQVRPNLVVHPQGALIEKRYRRHQKLHNKQKERNIDRQPEIGSILKSISSNSYDSSVHDIYNLRVEQVKFTQQKVNLHIQPEWALPLWASSKTDDLDEAIRCTMNTEIQRMKNIQSKKAPQNIKCFLKQSKDDEPIKRPSKPNLKLNLDKLQMNQDKLNLDRLQQVKIIQLMQFSRLPKSTRNADYSQTPAYEQARGFLTDRQPHRLEDELQLFKGNGQVQAKSQRRNSQVDKTHMKSSKHEQEQLLSMLWQQTSKATSPSRRLEIKLSLNRLILEQQTTMKSALLESQLDNSYGFWTHRNNKQSVPLNFRSIATIKSPKNADSKKSFK